MNDMAHDAHSLLGAYALDAVDADEREAFEAHLAACEDCRDEVASLRDVVAELADAEAIAPPASLRASVMERVAQTPQLPPTQAPRVASLADASARRSRTRRLWPLAAAAAAVVAMAGAGLGLTLFNGDGDQVSALERDVMTLASAPDAHTMELSLGQSHLVMSDRMDEVAIMGHAAPMPEDGMEYQLWMVLDDGTAMPGPTFMPDHDGDVMTLTSMDGHHIAAFSVTEEPHGGSVAPTGRMVASIDL